ncbi:MAG: cyclic nucleotide-binding domain-containing protein [Burkholderiales bacterium]
MAAPAQSLTIETRRHQMFPVLEPAQLERLHRFGEPRAFADGERLVRAGEAASSMFVILKGEIAATHHDAVAQHEPFVTIGRGGFTGELAQLSGRPALVDIHARGSVETIAIPSHRIRDLMVEEAELGERMMRALILRRVGLVESGVGPIIIGRADSADVLRLEGFLTRNGHPHQRLEPETDPCANALLERFEVDVRDLPIVLCPGGELLRNPSEVELARCIGMVSTIDPDKLFDAAIVGAGPAGLAAAVYAASEGFVSLCSIAAPSAARPALPRASKTIWAFRPEFPAWR